MDKIYTIGYGRLENSDQSSKWSSFFKRLLDADISCVVDIRRAGSKSRNGKAFWWGYGPDGEYWMGDRLFETGIEYFAVPELSNANKGLHLFRIHLELNPYYLEPLREIISEFATGNICLMCCERDWKQCHRKIVAQFVADQLELEVVHL